MIPVNCDYHVWYSKEKVDLPKFSIGLNRCLFSPNNDRWLFLGSFDLGCFRKIYLFKTWLNSRSHYHFFLHSYGLHPDTAKLSTVSCHLAVGCLSMCSISSPCQPILSVMVPYIFIKQYGGAIGFRFLYLLSLVPRLSLSCCRSSATVH